MRFLWLARLVVPALALAALLGGAKHGFFSPDGFSTGR